MKFLSLCGGNKDEFSTESAGGGALALLLSAALSVNISAAYAADNETSTEQLFSVQLVMEKPQDAINNSYQNWTPTLVDAVNGTKYEEFLAYGEFGFNVPAGTYHIEISGKCYGALADEPQQSYRRTETVTVVEGEPTQVVKLPFENLSFCGEVRGHIDYPTGANRDYEVEVNWSDHPSVAPGGIYSLGDRLNADGSFVKYNVKPGTYHFTVIPKFGKGEFGLPLGMSGSKNAPSLLGFPDHEAGLVSSPYCEELITDAQGVSAVVVEAGKSVSFPRWTLKDTCVTDADAKIHIDGSPAVGQTITARLSDIDLTGATVKFQWYGKLYDREWNDWSTGQNIFGWEEKYALLPSTADFTLPEHLQGKQVKAVVYVTYPGKNALALISEPVIVGAKKLEDKKNESGSSSDVPPKTENKNTTGKDSYAGENKHTRGVNLKADGSLFIPGAHTTLNGEGFLPGEDIRLEFHSDPVVLGTVKADLKGTFTAQIMVPSHAIPGQHHFVAYGLSSGKVSTIAVKITSQTLSEVKKDEAENNTPTRILNNHNSAEKKTTILAQTGFAAEGLLFTISACAVGGVLFCRRWTR